MALNMDVDASSQVNLTLHFRVFYGDGNAFVLIFDVLVTQVILTNL